MLPVPFDSHSAARLRSQIDPCAFRVVKQYFRTPASEIEMVVVVQEPYALEEVAAAFVTPDNAEATLQTLLGQGVIRVGVDDLSGVQAGIRDCVVLLDSIPDQQHCHVISLPPCDSVQMRNPMRVCRPTPGAER